MTIPMLAEHYNCSEWVIKDRLNESRCKKVQGGYQYYVYRITNNINNKKYIGKRKCKCGIENDKYLGSGIILKKAIKKYGKENFSKEILEVCETEEEAYEREVYWIAYYNATNSDEYYNISEGGTGVIGEINTFGKHIVKIDIETGKVIKEYKSVTEGHRDLDLFEYSNTLNNVCRRKVGLAYNFLWLYKVDYEEMQNNNTYEKWYISKLDKYKRKVEKENKKKELLKGKAVLKLDKTTLDVIEEYENVEVVSKSLGVKKTELMRACKGESTNFKGYSWLYKDLYDSLSKEEICNLLAKLSEGRTRVKCINTGFVFETIAAAKKWVGKDVHIDLAIQGIKKTAGKHPETGEPLYWKEVERPVDGRGECVESHRELVCLTTNCRFNSIADAIRALGLSESINSSISKAARGVRETAGKHPETGEPLRWTYIINY